MPIAPARHTGSITTCHTELPMPDTASATRHVAIESGCELGCARNASKFISMNSIGGLGSGAQSEEKPIFFFKFSTTKQAFP